MDIQQFWSDILVQRADEIRKYFHTDAYVNWHCSNEHFTVEEFIRANCEYPGDWDGKVEKIVTTDDMQYYIQFIQQENVSRETPSKMIIWVANLSHECS